MSILIESYFLIENKIFQNFKFKFSQGRRLYSNTGSAPHKIGRTHQGGTRPHGGRRGSSLHGEKGRIWTQVGSDAFRKKTRSQYLCIQSGHLCNPLPFSEEDLTQLSRFVFVQLIKKWCALCLPVCLSVSHWTLCDGRNWWTTKFWPFIALLTADL